MTTPRDSDHDPDAVAAEAVELVVALLSGEATTTDAAHIREWRARSPAHEAAFEDALRSMKGMRAVFHHAKRENLERAHAASGRRDGLRHARASRRAWLFGGGAAAAAAVVGIATPPLGLWPSFSELSADYRTAKGERRTVSFVADVRLELNTQTSVATRRTPDGPGLELISGEAIIESRLGPHRRLFVAAADGVVSASDARFNMLCIDGVATVTCLDGAVDVRRDGATATLKRLERVTYSRAGLTAASTVERDRAAAWTDGLLVFRDRPLGDVVGEVNRYRPGRIVIVNPSLGRRIVNGTFRIDQLQSFVAQVEQLFGARATPSLGGLIILS